MKVLRWALTAPAAVAAWYATFLVGSFAHQFTEKAICPAGELISGSCMNGNVQRWLEGVIVIFVAMSAIAVVSAAVATAPSHKAAVAWVVFVAGGVVAAYFAVATHLYLGGLAAVGSGLATAVLIQHHHRRKNQRPGTVAVDAT